MATKNAYNNFNYGLVNKTKNAFVSIFYNVLYEWFKNPWFIICIMLTFYIIEHHRGQEEENEAEYSLIAKYTPIIRKPWNEIMASPRYQALSASEQLYAQETYFLEVGVPNAKHDADRYWNIKISQNYFSGTLEHQYQELFNDYTKHEIEAAHDAFFSEYPPRKDQQKDDASVSGLTPIDPTYTILPDYVVLSEAIKQ